MPEKTITVLLVEDDAEVRRRFETTINQDPMMKVVGFASTKHEAQQLIETLDFEVMVIDLGLPDGSGIDLIRLANRLHPSSNIMVITVYGDEQHVVSSIEAGATGYILKEADSEDITGQIRLPARRRISCQPVSREKRAPRAAESSDRQWHRS